MPLFLKSTLASSVAVFPIAGIKDPESRAPSPVGTDTMPAPDNTLKQHRRNKPRGRERVPFKEGIALSLAGSW